MDESDHSLSEPKKIPVPTGIEWRFAAKRPKFLFLDAAVAVPFFMIAVLHSTVITWTLFTLVCLGLWVCEHFLKMPFADVYRSVRRILAGSRRPAVPWWKQNKL